MSESSTFMAEARWARQKAELGKDVYRDLMLAMARTFEALAQLEEATAQLEPLPDIIDADLRARAARLAGAGPN
jgi:hypothetical protein